MTPEKVKHLPWEKTTDPARLRIARLGLRKSQQATARILGITHAAYSRWENAHATPQPAHRERLWKLIHLGEKMAAAKEG